MTKMKFQSSDKILDKIKLSDSECLTIYRKVILLFELAAPDDDAYSLYDERIKNHCAEIALSILPMNTVSDVDDFCQNEKALLRKYSSGFVVFSHNGKNQLRQMIHHMRNACSHAGIGLKVSNSKEYMRFEAKGLQNGKTKLLALIMREHFEPFWDIVLSTLKFS